MYLQHFELGDFPFIQSSKDELYFVTPNAESQCVLFHHWLDAGQGLFVVAGEEGVGRASFAHHALDTSGLQKIERYVVGKLPLSAREFLLGLALEMNVSCTGTDCMEIRHAIRSRLLSQASLQHRMCILVHDAHKLDEQTLAFIEDLSREHSLYLPLCHIVLLVDKVYANRIAKKKRSAHARHIHHVASIKGLSRAETVDYIYHRFDQANAPNPNLFSDNVISQIYRQSQGKPQLVNALCDRVLCNAFVDRASTLTQKHVNDAITKLGWESRLGSPVAKHRRKKLHSERTQRQPQNAQKMGALERSVHELVSGVTTIGRAPDCAIRLNGAQFSPYQALIVRNEDGMFIRNEGSQVPLYLNGGTVDSANLTTGDCVRLGGYQFSVDRDEQGKLALIATEASS